MEKFIVANEVAIRVADTQKGDRTVVLLHGYLENLGVWEALTEMLMPHVRVVALDLPGHGISQVVDQVHTMAFLSDVVADALHRLGVAKCCVTGHSMGGYVALEMTARHGEMVESLVLLSSTPNADSPEKRENREREIAIVEGGKKDLLGRMLPEKGFAASNRRRMRKTIEDYTEMVYMTEDEGITALLRGMMERRDMNETMRTLAIPQVMIFGRHDEYIPVEAAEAIIAAQEQARVVWLENSGHNGHVEEAAAVYNEILEVIDIK